MKPADHFGKRRVRLKGRNAACRIRTTPAQLHGSFTRSQLPLEQTVSESAPVCEARLTHCQRLCEQRTQPCVSGRLHCGGGVVAATEHCQLACRRSHETSVTRGCGVGSRKWSMAAVVCCQQLALSGETQVSTATGPARHHRSTKWTLHGRDTSRVRVLPMSANQRLLWSAMRYDRSWRASAYCAPCALRPEGDMQLVHKLTLGLTFASIASDAMRSAGLTRNSPSTTQHSPSAISGEHPQSGHTHAARVAFRTSATAEAESFDFVGASGALWSITVTDRPLRGYSRRWSESCR